MTDLCKILLHSRLALAALLVAPLLAGCSDTTKRALGWEKESPDEFTVVTRAPLTQPPDYDLRPPSPGAVRPQEGSTIDQARKALIGPATGTPTVSAASDNPALAGLSPGEIALLKASGAQNATSDIRRQVNEDSTVVAEESASFVDDILFWRETLKPGEILDPEKEAKRLQTNASLNKPATEGDTPLIVRKQKGWLEDIF